jgi:hypothetical protein
LHEGKAAEKHNGTQHAGANHVHSRDTIINEQLNKYSEEFPLHEIFGFLLAKYDLLQHLLEVLLTINSNYGNL